MRCFQERENGAAYPTLSTGAPKGKANGNWKHGAHTNEAIALRRAAGALLREVG